MRLRVATRPGDGVRVAAELIGAGLRAVVSPAACAAARLGSIQVAMIEIIRTNDLVLLSAIDALLTGADIEFMVADQHMSSLEGSAGFLPRRILVPADRVDRARRLLRDAGLAQNLLHE